MKSSDEPIAGSSSGGSLDHASSALHMCAHARAVCAHRMWAVADLLVVLVRARGQPWAPRPRSVQIP